MWMSFLQLTNDEKMTCKTILYVEWNRCQHHVNITTVLKRHDIQPRLLTSYWCSIYIFRSVSHSKSQAVFKQFSCCIATNVGFCFVLRCACDETDFVYIENFQDLLLTQLFYTLWTYLIATETHVLDVRYPGDMFHSDLLQFKKESIWW